MFTTGQRLDLHQILLDLLETDNVYFQPPETVKMEYPCIKYERDFSDTKYADNNPYRFTKRYLVTVIARDPDSAIPDRVAQLPTARHNRFYTADNLNHDVFQIYF